MKTTVKAIKYKTKIYEGILDHVHGSYQIIEEVYIPSVGVCFNDKGFAFASEGPRKDTQYQENIDIDIEISKKLANYVELQQEIKTNYFKAVFNKDLTK